MANSTDGTIGSGAEEEEIGEEEESGTEEDSTSEEEGGEEGEDEVEGVEEEVSEDGLICSTEVVWIPVQEQRARRLRRERKLDFFIRHLLSLLGMGKE